MKVYHKGKVVKDAVVQYYGSGVPAFVIVDGVQKDASAYEFKDEKENIKTKDVKKSETKKKTVKK